VFFLRSAAGRGRPRRCKSEGQAQQVRSTKGVCCAGEGLFSDNEGRACASLTNGRCAVCGTSAWIHRFLSNSIDLPTSNALHQIDISLHMHKGSCNEMCPDLSIAPAHRNRQSSASSASQRRNMNNEHEHVQRPACLGWKCCTPANDWYHAPHPSERPTDHRQQM